MRKYFALAAVVVMVALFSGCASETGKSGVTTATPTPSMGATQTPTPAPEETVKITEFDEKELIKRIDTELNPKRYSKSIDYINVVKKDNQLNVSYISYYASMWQGGIYKQTTRVIDVINDYLSERGSGIEIVKIKAVDRDGNEYVFEIATEDIPKLLNEQCGFVEWKKAIKYGKKYMCEAQPLPLGTRLKDLSKIIEEAFQTSSGSAYLGYVNARLVGNELVVGYASYVPDWESDVYGQMVEVMKVILEYTEEKGLTFDSVKIVHTLRDKGDYALQVDREEMEKFITAEWGFKEWQGRVLKRVLN